MQFCLELEKACNELQSNPAGLACQSKVELHVRITATLSKKNREVTKRNFKLSSLAKDLWVHRMASGFPVIGRLSND